MDNEKRNTYQRAYQKKRREAHQDFWRRYLVSRGCDPDTYCIEARDTSVRPFNVMHSIDNVLAGIETGRYVISPKERRAPRTDRE